MPEPTDVILPILQKIQADIADVKRDLGGKIDGLGRRMDGLDGRMGGLDGRMNGLTDRMDAFEAYFTHTMGLTQQNIVDIRRLRADIALMQTRLNGPEASR